jgi:Na+/proline symporter/nitrogen-specific signal transduction histidine kinase
MLTTGAILAAAFFYIALLFSIAYFGDRCADAGRSIISNPTIYALSMAVYCTAWTFYGSVGRAVETGVGFLPTYIGPTLVAVLGLTVLKKIIRIGRIHHITSIADFITSRYGKSALLGSVVTIIAVLGIVPYISLQLKAVSTSFLVFSHFPGPTGVLGNMQTPFSFLGDTAFYAALILAVFSILFGTRHLDVTERHEGLVAAIAFESVVKLAAFLAVGIFVTWGVFEGFDDIIRKASNSENLQRLFTIDRRPGMYANWSMGIFLSMLAFLCLPRQFQVAVVENVDEEHLNRAMWLFPLYLLLINLFVLPIALGGEILFQGKSVEADTYVLSLPLLLQQKTLAIFVFIGGISAATGMVIVETVALSTMICNDLVMPVLLRLPRFRSERGDVSRLIMTIRRSSIVLVLLMGYIYLQLVGEFYQLVSIGLVSFAAVAQFAPSILIGIFWKGGSRRGALWGLLSGFGVWAYTLVIPSLVQTGVITDHYLFLRPYPLFGMGVLDPISHAVFWSLLANSGIYLVVSLFSRPDSIEQAQANLFVDVFAYPDRLFERPRLWRGTASVPDLISLLKRFLGEKRTRKAMAQYAWRNGTDWHQKAAADAGFVSYSEKLLAGAIGSASARVLVSSVVKEEALGIEEVLDILEETRQAIAHSQKLERLTRKLERANEQLKELDRLKDEFLSTVTHELRTPLTAIRSLAEILHDNPDVGYEQHRQFTGIITRESERLSRLITNVLDFQKIQTGNMVWHFERLQFADLIDEALGSLDPLIRSRQIRVERHFQETIPDIRGDRDRLIQVMVNLLSNAVKFCDPLQGWIGVTLAATPQGIKVVVADNGRGVLTQEKEEIFKDFRQISDERGGKPAGTGLGLSITRKIVRYHGGEIWVEESPQQGAAFVFLLPYSPRLNK